MRSGHSLAFNQFEEIVSFITIRASNRSETTVLKLLEKYKYSMSQAISPFQINWEAESNWNSDELPDKIKGSSLLIPIPKSSTNGLMLREKGYSESIESLSEYHFLSDGTFILLTNYGNTIAEERIWFLSENVRCRSSVVRTSNGGGIMQTSFASEIRRLTS